MLLLFRSVIPQPFFCTGRRSRVRNAPVLYARFSCKLIREKTVVGLARKPRQP